MATPQSEKPLAKDIFSFYEASEGFFSQTGVDSREDSGPLPQRCKFVHMSTHLCLQMCRVPILGGDFIREPWYNEGTIKFRACSRSDVSPPWLAPVCPLV